MLNSNAQLEIPYLDLGEYSVEEPSATGYDVHITGSVYLGSPEIKLMVGEPLYREGGWAPGDTLHQDIFVKNISTQNVSIRAKISVIPEEPNLPTDGFELTYNQDWELKADGWYHYKKVLEPGQETSNLLEEIKLNINIGNEWQGKDFIVQPVAESEGNNSAEITVTNREKSSSGKDSGRSSNGSKVIINPEDPTVEIEDKLNKEDHSAYVIGYPDNTVRPEDYITREEVSAVFYRLLTPGYRNSIKTNSHSFLDIETGRWSGKHIRTLSSARIIEGYPDETFRPANNITRAELATIASRFDKLSPFTGNNFTDIAGHWGNRYINSAARKGWVNGYPDGTFKPDQHITRAEFMTLVNNVLDRRVHQKDILSEARQFPDLSKDAWYYEEVQEAINSHHYKRLPDTFEEWIDIYYPVLDV